jgi:hypothetical protein
VPGMDRQRKAEIRAGTAWALNGHTEKSDAFRAMLRQAVPYSAWQGQLEKSRDKGRHTLGRLEI